MEPEWPQGVPRIWPLGCWKANGGGAVGSPGGPTELDDGADGGALEDTAALGAPNVTKVTIKNSKTQ